MKKCFYLYCNYNSLKPVQCTVLYYKVFVLHLIDTSNCDFYCKSHLIDTSNCDFTFDSSH